MMNTINLNLYNVLRKDLNLTEEKSQNVAKAIQETVIENVAGKEATTKELVNSETKGLATKDDIIALQKDIIGLQKWMIGLFITVALIVIGLYFKK